MSDDADRLHRLATAFAAHVLVEFGELSESLEDHLANVVQLVAARASLSFCHVAMREQLPIDKHDEFDRQAAALHALGDRIARDLYCEHVALKQKQIDEVGERVRTIAAEAMREKP